MHIQSSIKKVIVVNYLIYEDSDSQSTNMDKFLGLIIAGSSLVALVCILYFIHRLANKRAAKKGTKKKVKMISLEEGFKDDSSSQRTISRDSSRSSTKSSKSSSKVSSF